jgi:hypothetical protein
MHEAAARRSTALADMEQRTEDLVRSVRREVQRAPVQSVALALAAGWVLGGGLSPRVLRLALATATRGVTATLVAAVVRGAFDQGRNR